MISEYSKSGKLSKSKIRTDGSSMACPLRAREEKKMKVQSTISMHDSESTHHQRLVHNNPGRQAALEGSYLIVITEGRVWKRNILGEDAGFCQIPETGRGPKDQQHRRTLTGGRRMFWCTLRRWLLRPLTRSRRSQFAQRKGRRRMEIAPIWHSGRGKLVAQQQEQREKEEGRG
jgi:hypothetical protein